MDVWDALRDCGAQMQNKAVLVLRFNQINRQQSVINRNENVMVRADAKKLWMRI